MNGTSKYETAIAILENRLANWLTLSWILPEGIMFPLLFFCLPFVTLILTQCVCVSAHALIRMLLCVRVFVCVRVY